MGRDPRGERLRPQAITVAVWPSVRPKYEHVFVLELAHTSRRSRGSRRWKEPLYIDNAAARRAIAREESEAHRLDFLRTHPCTDCGEADPAVLDFDHAGDKLLCIGGDISSSAWGSVLEEIAKCDVVCANCHAERTHQRHAEYARQRQRAREAS